MGVYFSVFVFSMLIAGFVLLGRYVKHRTVELAQQLDGRLTQLLTVTKALARAEGIAEGIAEEKEERRQDREFEARKNK